MLDRNTVRSGACSSARQSLHSHLSRPSLRLFFSKLSSRAPSPTYDTDHCGSCLTNNWSLDQGHPDSQQQRASKQSQRRLRQRQHILPRSTSLDTPVLQPATLGHISVLKSQRRPRPRQHVLPRAPSLDTLRPRRTSSSALVIFSAPSSPVLIIVACIGSTHRCLHRLDSSPTSARLIFACICLPLQH